MGWILLPLSVTARADALLQLGCFASLLLPALRVGAARSGARLLPQALQVRSSRDGLELGLFADHGHV